MQRRYFLACGAFGAAWLSLHGALWAQPGHPIAHGQLTATGRMVLVTVARAVLAGMLPASTLAREEALQRLVRHLDVVVAGLPQQARGELAQLLSIAASAPGRRLLIGLAPSWTDATPQQVSQALAHMRRSRFRLRQQAYQALRELVCGAYFADPLSWPDLGYPGPLPLNQDAPA